MNHTPFTAIGDEPIEARIVAWVLGEASAFEVAELERLCEERPELLVFRRRMMALHQLLKDAADSQGSEAWKLVPDKRRALDDLLGSPPAAASAPMIEKRVRRSGRRALLAIAACVIFTVVVGGLTAPMVGRQRKHADRAAAANDAKMDELLRLENGMVMESAGEGSGKVRLSSEIPAEMIEGTPAPIILPGAASNEPGLAKKEARGSGPSATPTAPAATMARRAVAAAAEEIPASAVEPGSPSLDFGDSDHGAGWGDDREGGTGGGATDGLASAGAGSGDAAIDSFAARESNGGELLAKSGAADAPLVLGASGRAFSAPAESGGLEERADKDDRLKQTAPAKPADLSSGPLVAEGKSGGREYEFHTGYADYYLFRGVDLEGDARIPEDASVLAKAIREQEDKVEERRKVLATIVRAKGILYKGEEKPKEEAIKRGLDAQDYVDAKKEFEKDQELLQQMKLKLQGAKPPQAALPDLMEEIIASEDPYSTFSLNISDASFQIAQAALAKGDRPDPAAIKVEQFYNAVDYGDPAPAAGQPVAATIEQAAHPVIPGRNLVRIALKTAAAGRSAGQPLRLTLLVDQSGSMSREDRRVAMDKAMKGLAGLLTKNDLVSIIGFSRTPRLLADGMPGNEAGKIPGLIHQAASEGGTNLEQAIVLAGQLAGRRQLAGAQNRIVLFTDGAANLGDADPVRLAEKVRELRQQRIAFDIAGIAADGLNDELLAELARNGDGRYYVVGKGGDDNLAEQLAGAFRPAAENVKVQVRFNPERVARYKLIGFEKDRLKTEDFRNDAVDAAELAAEEAGVAIYQVEPLPGGSGELGEVSVRFRDTAGDRMVERGWSIPYDSGVPAIDRGTPSMQLAVLAMFAAEKLRGGPLADAIDFRQLAGPRAETKRYYAGSSRVAEMLHMIDSL